MSRIASFNSPLLLGFEHLERLLDHVSKGAGETYPPYNIEKIGANRLRITLAVAGFAAEDLTVTVEEGQLIVRGRKPEEAPERLFLHRGIASRQFRRVYLLADGIEVTGATLDNGLLNIDLDRPLPEPSVRTIAIGRTNGEAAKPQCAIPVDRSRDGAR